MSKTSTEKEAGLLKLFEHDEKGDTLYKHDLEDHKWYHRSAPQMPGEKAY